ncbi:TFIIB-type zinc ribbon-containing protein [Candidatus Nitrosocosmicus hydrocola]|uniref:TFIIB-type zinc ribbon-containing protein n=1 Tax=Candidatus Nitrosocosmicus hydrocola TaxID=1826872 RepID=UPI0011E5F725|nr:TFIIB-type zinc ribbon-containing protein [Candidatus Nitrosocosmicus hydrocola]
MSNIVIVNPVNKLDDSQIQLHHHSVIYDYTNGEKICKECGIVIQDNLYDTELDINFYKHKSDTNTVLPHSLMLSDSGMSTAIADYDATSSRRFSNRKEHNKVEFLSKIVSYSNKKRNLKIVIDLLNRIKDKLFLTSTCIEDALLYYKKGSIRDLLREGPSEK